MCFVFVRIVPIAYSEQALEKYPSAQLKVISGLGHSFNGEDADQAVGYMLEYLKRQVSY